MIGEQPFQIWGFTKKCNDNVTSWLHVAGAWQGIEVVDVQSVRQSQSLHDPCRWLPGSDIALHSLDGLKGCCT